jgi:hypothetical protein
MSRRAKNNNLNKYREEQTKNNEILIRKAIAHIDALGGKITFSSVSKVSYDLAPSIGKEKGLSSAGITKNSIYRSLVNEAKARQSLGEIVPVKKNLSQGDMHLTLHALRVEVEKLRIEKKTLKHKLKEIPCSIQNIEPIRNEIIMMNNQLKDIAKTMVNQLCDLEIAYIDLETRSLRLAVYGTTIVHHDALEIFYKKELDAIKN